MIYSPFRLAPSCAAQLSSTQFGRFLGHSCFVPQSTMEDVEAMLLSLWLFVTLRRCEFLQIELDYCKGVVLVIQPLTQPLTQSVV